MTAIKLLLPIIMLLTIMMVAIKTQITRQCEPELQSCTVITLTRFNMKNMQHRDLSFSIECKGQLNMEGS